MNEDKEKNVNLINEIISMLNFMNFKQGTQGVRYENGVYFLSGKTRTDNRVFEFDFDEDGTVLGTFREVLE